MKLFIKYDINILCKTVVQEQLQAHSIPYELHGLGEINIKEKIDEARFKELLASLKKYGIEEVENTKSILVQKIKDAITEIVFVEEELPTSKISAFLSEKLHHSYGYLANVFSEVTFTSIENFIILQKIERAKMMIVTNEHTFTEIAYILNYSSVAHFSTQFKNATGLTPSAFKRIMNKRKNIE